MEDSKLPVPVIGQLQSELNEAVRAHVLRLWKLFTEFVKPQKVEV